jgi:drug/metabolite transporter (DMT)-like permease
MNWIADLLLLAAIWGGSFILMRFGALEFGPIGTAFLRVLIATVFLFGLLAARRQVHVLRAHWKASLFVGLLNSGIPFALFSFAVLSISTGLTSILNATTPLWGALVASVWFKDKLTPQRAFGMLVGVAGVTLLSWDQVGFKPGGTGWAVLACLAATLCYGISASYTKRYLTGVAPLATATGSQLGATLGLALPALYLMPSLSGPGAPGLHAWLAIIAVAVVCTGIAYILFFRLIQNAGPQRALTVTFLIPVFGLAYGAVFLDEAVTLKALAAGALILLGTALSAGLLKLPARAAALPGEAAEKGLGR